ncbi:MAG: EAL domain-containing protein [Thiohalomonadaceae bacterium]
MRAKINCIKTKLTLLLAATIILTLLLIGVPIANLLKHQHTQEANQEFDRAFTELGTRLQQREEQIKNHTRRLAVQDEIIASLNMIANYARPDDYQALIFDNEKRQLVDALRREVLAGAADTILIYDQSGQLQLFVAEQQGGVEGYLSYQDARPRYWWRTGPSATWQATQRPAWFEAVLPRDWRRAAMFTRYLKYHDTLVLQTSIPLMRYFPDGSSLPLGYLVLRQGIDAGFVRDFSRQSALGFSLVFNDGLILGDRNIPAEKLNDIVTLEDLPANIPQSHLHHNGYYLAAFRLRLDGNTYVDWIFSRPTADVNAAIKASWRLILWFIIATIAVVLPLAIWMTHRVINKPLDALGKAVDAVSQGNYQFKIPVQSQDELGRLSHAFNSMSSIVFQRQIALQESERRYRVLVDSLPQRIYYKDRESNYLSCNRAYADDFGMKVEELVGKSDFELYSESVAQQMRDDDARVIQQKRTQESEIPYAVGDQDLIVHNVKLPTFDEDGGVDGVLCIFWDITEQKQNENRLRQSAAVFESTADGVVVTDLNSRIIAVNRAFYEITGYNEQETIGNKTSFRRSERQGREFYEAMWREIKHNGSWQGEIWNRRKSGEVYPEWMTISVVRDHRGQVINYVAVFSDITRVIHSQMKLEHMANHDPLTDLPNRVLLNDRLSQAIYRAERKGCECAVLFIDLDRFKNVNDTLGHPAGDTLLREVGLRLQGLLRSQDTVARLGGDEFIILLEDVERPEFTELVATKVIDAMSLPFVSGGKEFFIGASIGVSIYPDDGLDASTLIMHADAAMYRAKEDGRNTYQFYTRELTADATDRLLLGAALRRAVEREELQVYYQPKVDLSNGKIIGAEALLRWIHPEMGFISPDKFIPLAEESGLILKIGEWVLRQACAQTVLWRNDYPDFHHMAVNISGVQVQRGNLVPLINAILNEYEMQSGQLHLEITESVLMQYPELATKVLTGLRDLGISLAVDDFGTGYSSLSYLKRFLIHTLKIDRSFVMDIPHDNNDMAITRAVIALGKSLQLKLVAEGVETLDQQTFLQQEGCDIGQGYFYSRPVPATDFLELLRYQRLPVQVNS